jgi:hypothetical protein
MYVEQYGQLDGPEPMTSGVRIPLHSGHRPMRSIAEEKAIEQPGTSTANQIRFLGLMFSTDETRPCLPQLRRGDAGHGGNDSLVQSTSCWRGAYAGE